MPTQSVIRKCWALQAKEKETPKWEMNGKRAADVCLFKRCYFFFESVKHSNAKFIPFHFNCSKRKDKGSLNKTKNGKYRIAASNSHYLVHSWKIVHLLFFLFVKCSSWGMCHQRTAAQKMARYHYASLSPSESKQQIHLFKKNIESFERIIFSMKISLWKYLLDNLIRFMKQNSQNKTKNCNKKALSRLKKETSAHKISTQTHSAL